MKISTSLVHQTNPLAQENNEVIEPLHTSTIFAMDEPSSHSGFQYGRVGNPTRLILNKTLAKYAQADFTICTSSGSAALSALFLALNSGEEVVCHDEVYEGSQRILQDHFSKFNIQPHFVDCRNEKLLEEHLKLHTKTKIILIETPTNPLLQIIDIRKTGQLAHQRNVLLVVDNTFATSLLQQPLDLGADVVIESLSKHINGHSDVIGGMLATNNEPTFKKVKNIIETLGFILSPRDADQVLRGMRTMKLRVDRQCGNAKKIARFLKNHKNVLRVLFPSGKLANSQMSQPGSIVSFNLTKKSSIFLQKLKLIKIAHSFGGTETLIQQPTTMMDLSFSKEQLHLFRIDDNFFRISVGIEDVEDIIDDLEQALSFS